MDLLLIISSVAARGVTLAGKVFLGPAASTPSKDCFVFAGGTLAAPSLGVAGAAVLGGAVLGGPLGAAADSEGGGLRGDSEGAPAGPFGGAVLGGTAFGLSGTMASCTGGF